MIYLAVARGAVLPSVNIASNFVQPSRDLTSNDATQSTSSSHIVAIQNSFATRNGQSDLTLKTHHSETYSPTDPVQTSAPTGDKPTELFQMTANSKAPSDPASHLSDHTVNGNHSESAATSSQGSSFVGKVLTVYPILCVVWHTLTINVDIDWFVITNWMPYFHLWCHILPNRTVYSWDKWTSYVKICVFEPHVLVHSNNRKFLSHWVTCQEIFESVLDRALCGWM